MDGDCFKVAANIVVHGLPDATLCHGQPIRRGPEGGDRYWHAWVELDGTAIDRANGLDIELAAATYYLIGNIEADKVLRYTREEAVRYMLETGHYGPWIEE